MTSPTNKIDLWLQKPGSKRLLGIIGVLIPVGFIIKKHVGWEDKPQDKARMLTHQLTFWTSLGIGVGLIHSAGFWKHLPFTKIPVEGAKRLACVLLGGVFAAAGFPMGRKLSKALFPYEEEKSDEKAALSSSLTPKPFSVTSQVAPMALPIPQTITANSGKSLLPSVAGSPLYSPYSPIMK